MLHDLDVVIIFKTCSTRLSPIIHNSDLSWRIFVSTSDRTCHGVKVRRNGLISLDLELRPII